MLGSLELVLAAVKHEIPERIPTTLYLDAGLRQRPEVQHARKGFTDDTVRILWNIEHRIVDDKNFYDPFGVHWIRSGGAYFFEDPPLVEPDSTRIPRVKLLPEGETDRIMKVREENPDKFIYYQFTMTFAERLWALRGMEQSLVDHVENHSFIHDALDVLLEMHLEAIDTLLTLPIDGVTFGDDFGSQKGMMIRPDTFRTCYRDRLGLMYRKVRDAGMVVGAHSCGDVTEILGDYVDIGLQVLHPLQCECMDIGFVKREYGKHLSFRGGIGVQGAVVHGTPDEVKEEVFCVARTLSEGGGYLMEPGKPLPAETPIDNVVAFIEAMQDASIYRF